MIRNNLQKAKTHVQANKTAYLAGAGGVVVGAVTVMLLRGDVRVTVDAYNFKWKSPTTNNVTNILSRRGHPGYLVRCLETGETFASQERAADLLNLNSARLSEHLNGMRDQVSGLHFERLGEAEAAA